MSGDDVGGEDSFIKTFHKDLRVNWLTDQPVKKHFIRVHMNFWHTQHGLAGNASLEKAFFYAILIRELRVCLPKSVLYRGPSYGG